MSEHNCYLVTVVYNEKQLLKTALKIKIGEADFEKFEYFMEDGASDYINTFLPLHAQGQVVDVEQLFEIVVIEQK